MAPNVDLEEAESWFRGTGSLTPHGRNLVAALIEQARRYQGATQEWAIRHPDGMVQTTASHYMAERLANMTTTTGERVRPGAVVVCREVSPWTEVSE